MFGLFRYKRPQTFHLTLSVGPWSADQVSAIPYPIAHPYQRVEDLHWTSDGTVVDQGGCLLVTNGTQATITATVHTQPVQLGGSPELRQCYDQTMAKLHYGAPIPGLYTLEDVQTLPAVDCGGFSVYLISLLEAAHIPARLVAGFWAGYAQNDMHAWVEGKLPDGTWLPLDPSTEWLRKRRRTKKYGGFGQIGSYRIVMSVGSDHVIHYHQTDYPVRMLQVPMILATDGTFSYLPNDHYRLITER